jgi:hypothetical protein
LIVFNRIRQYLKASVIRKASSGSKIDIVEVRTKDLALATVTTETDIRIRNSFFLPFTILSIQTDLLNREGLKIGEMKYGTPVKIKAHSDQVITAISEISIITSIFQAISNLLMQNISMRSSGFATIRILWWTIQIPVDDFFEIHPARIKLIKDETPEERQQREQRAAARREKLQHLKQERKSERAERKEEMLRKRHREHYIPKEERRRMDQPEQKPAGGSTPGDARDTAAESASSEPES